MRVAKWVGVWLATACCACGVLEPQRDDTRFYVLASSDELGRTAHEPAATPLSAGLGPVSLPAYVLRPQIVRRTSATELAPAKRDVWAEPIDRAFGRVLARDLALALGAPSVASYPWQPDRAPRWQVAVDVERFELDAQGQALLVARWRAIEWPARSVRVEREARLVAPAAADDAGAQTRALSEVVDRLAAQIASGLAELH